MTTTEKETGKRYGWARRRKGRTERMAFNFTPTERHLIEQLADIDHVPFNDAVIKAVRNEADRRADEIATFNRKSKEKPE